MFTALFFPSAPRHAAPDPLPDAPRPQSAQHARGRGRYRQPQPHRSVRGALAIAAVTVASTVGLSALVAGTNQPVAVAGETVVVEFQPSAEQTVVVEAARLTCDNLNLASTLSEDDSEQKRAARQALDSLQDAVADASVPTDTVLVLEGVPLDTVDAYRRSEIPVRKLVGAATKVEASTKDGAAGGQNTPTVSAAIELPATQEVAQAAQALDLALADLPVTERIAVLGPEAVDPRELSDEDLETLIAEDVDERYQEEKDSRLAQSLPDLTDATNGEIAEELLCPIPWAPNYQLLCATVPNLERLNDAFREQFGHDLTIQSAYRSYEEQVVAHETSPYMTTLPGTSNHSWGLAVDFDISAYSTYDHPEVVWLVEHGPDYGWRNPTLESFQTASEEPWHFEFGTEYPDRPNDGFNGPAPTVKYVFKLPEGARTETLLSIG